MFSASEYHLIRRANKIPVDPGWARVSTELYNEHRANHGEVGLVCGGERGIYVLDVDTDKATGQVTQETLEILMALDLPETLKVPTPSGGCHYFFQSNENWSRRIRVAPGIDWLGEKSYVALYEPLKQYDTDMINGIPRKVRELLERPVVNGEDPGKMAPGNRNQTIASLTGQLLKSGGDLRETHEYVQKLNAQTARPLPRTEVAHTVASISRYHEPPPEPIPRVELFGQTPEEVMSLNLPPIVSLIGPLMGGTTTTLHGASGAGKSLFALHVGLHLAAGSDFQHWRVPEPKRVLYLDQENPSPYVQSRMMSLPTEGRFRIAHRHWLKSQGLKLNLGLKDHQDALLVHEPDLLIIDSLMALNTPDSKVTMNDPEWFERLMPLFDAITDRGGAVWILGNLNRRGEMYGTAAQEWRADRNWSGEAWEQTDTRYTAGLHLDGTKERGLTEVEVKSSWRFSLVNGWENVK